MRFPAPRICNGLLGLFGLLVTRAAAGQPADCQTTAAYLGVRETQAGLDFLFEGATQPRVTRESSAELGAGDLRLYTAVVEFEGAENKTGAEARELVLGPVQRVRAVPYRRATECGVRLYIEMRSPVTLDFEKRAGGFVLAAAANVSAGAAPQAARAPQRIQASGGAQLSVLMGPSSFGGETTYSGILGLGVYQEVLNTGWVRGFLTRLVSNGPGSTYGGVGLFGYPLRAARLDLTAGDVAIPFASPLQDSAVAPGQLLMRGAAVSIREGRRFRLWAFYGRSATPDALRLIGTSQTASDISDDSVGGVFGFLTRGRLSLGGGWVLSAPRDLRTRNNFFEGASFAFADTVKAGAVVEESFSDRKGWQATFAPTIRLPSFYLMGYYRYASDGFLPALGSNYFAGLRRSFQAAGAYRVASALTVGAAAGQTRTFNLFDPLSVATVTEFGDANLSARLPGDFTTGLFVRTARTRTEPGALNPSDSRTYSYGLDLGAIFGTLSVTASLSRDETTDDLDTAQNFRSTRVSLNVVSPLFKVWQATLQATYADSRRESGASAGPNYSVSLGLDRRLARDLSAGLLAGVDVRPAGVATFSSTSTRVSAHGYWTSHFGLQAGASFGYQRLTIEGSPTINGYTATVNLTQSFDWGGRPGPFNDAGTRSFSLQEAVPDAQLRGTIELVAFVDENANGRRDSGERGLDGIGFQIDGDSYRTDVDGVLRVFVLPGVHEVRFTTGKLDIRLGPGFSDPGEATVPAKATVTMLRPFVYSGRIEGRVVFTGTLPKDASAPVSGLLVRLLRNGAVAQETYTQDQGEFLFGNIVPGWYEVEIPAQSVPEEYAVEGLARLAVEVPRDKPARPVFSLRKRSARERFGGGGGAK